MTLEIIEDLNIKVSIKVDLTDFESEIKNVVLDALGIEVSVSKPEKDKKTK